VLSLVSIDPFLYYSIPVVHEAALSPEEVDYSKVLQSACKVSRKTRVSYEKRADAVLLDELSGDEELDGLDESNLFLGEFDEIVKLLCVTE